MPVSFRSATRRFFGLGAYAAGSSPSWHFVSDPIWPHRRPASVAAALGFVTSFLVLRGHDLTRLMVTLGVALDLGEIANSASGSPAAPGLQGVKIAPDSTAGSVRLFGHTGYLYSLAILFVLTFMRGAPRRPFALRPVAPIHQGNALRAAPSASTSMPGSSPSIPSVPAYAGVAGALLGADDGTIGLPRHNRLPSFGRLAAHLFSAAPASSMAASSAPVIRKVLQDGIATDAAVLGVLARPPAGAAWCCSSATDRPVLDGERRGKPCWRESTIALTHSARQGKCLIRRVRTLPQSASPPPWGGAGWGEVPSFSA